MDQKIIVRRATLGDAEIITGLNRAMALETEGITLAEETSAYGVRQPFKDPSLGLYIVAQCDESIVGSLMITTEWSDWRGGDFWWIQSVYIRPEFRRQGVYRSLYRFVQELVAADPGVCGVRLYAELDNKRAQKTYKVLGMEQLDYIMFEQLKDGLEFLQ